MAKKRQEISDDLVTRLSEFINLRMGLHFPRKKWRDLKRNISAVSRELGFDHVDDCIKWLLSAQLTDAKKDVLISHMTIGEAFFFRDKFVFEALKERILPGLLESHHGKNKEITFWSAACCTGEEPYSIAMLLDQMPAFLGWKIRILGTDINSKFLQKARKGIYTPWSFRDTPDEILKRYFKKTGKERFEISPRIRNMVRYSRYNLAKNGYPPDLGEQGKVEVLFCRNALMYLSPDMQVRTIRRLTSYLHNGGWFITSPTESPLVQGPGLNSVRFPGAILHRKGPPRRPDRKKAAAFITPAPVSPTTRPTKPVFRKKPSRPKPVPVFPKTEKRQAPKRDLYQEALALYEKARYEEAAEILNRSLSHGKAAGNSLLIPEQTVLLAKANANMGRLDEARKWCEEAVGREKLHPEYRFLLATIYQEQGLVEESTKSLKHTIYLDPGLVMAYYLLGHLTKGQGKPGESGRYLKNALDLLSSMEPEAVVPHSDGLTSERLRESIGLMMGD